MFLKCLQFIVIIVCARVLLLQFITIIIVCANSFKSRVGSGTPYNLALRRQRPEDCEFKVSQVHKDPLLKNKTLKPKTTKEKEMSSTE